MGMGVIHLAVVVFKIPDSQDLVVLPDIIKHRELVNMSEARVKDGYYHIFSPMIVLVKKMTVQHTHRFPGIAVKG
jgi:hypothetical protein